MFTKLYSAALRGVDATEVEIEVNIGGGDTPAVVIVGLPDAAVRESRDRVYTALKNCGFRPPTGRTTINLAPADLKKEGPSFDLPIALGMLAKNEDFDDSRLERYCMVGELALDGTIRPVKGILSVAEEACRRGRNSLIVPKENAIEASAISDARVYGVSHLREAYDLVTGEIKRRPQQRDLEKLFAHANSGEIDFCDVKGQASVKRAIEVAVAGNHNILMIGPPGTGKSMLSKRIPTIMPRMTEKEAIETTKIHSIAGFLGERNSIVCVRPFRAPHHTISDAGLLGGSSKPNPGEVSLAHNGVLFLDELPEFRRSTLEVMRQPLEDGKVTISRASGTMTFPAAFMLVAAMNPCPCGYYGDPKRECRCSPKQIDNYRSKISGPLLDRIDLHVEVPLVEYKDLATADPGEPSEPIQHRVESARQIQTERFAATNHVSNNSHMTPKLMKEHCQLGAESRQYLDHAMNEMNFSARAHDRILKVSRTLADLDASSEIEPNHVLEAIQYRSLDRNYWI